MSVMTVQNQLYRVNMQIAQVQTEMYCPGTIQRAYSLQMRMNKLLYRKAYLEQRLQAEVNKAQIQANISVNRSMSRSFTGRRRRYY